MSTETIVAIATATGRGGVGIVRVSGPLSSVVAQALVPQPLKPRVATYTDFISKKEVIDQGLAIWFQGPHSYTGEDVLELQGHGGPVILDMIIDAVLSIKGVRLAEPGEFSKRAFLNDKLDLAQAEAVSDLIEASSLQAARSAMQTLKGAFSHAVTNVVEQLTALRMHIEAAIDFPEEEIDFLSDGQIAKKLLQVQNMLDTVLAEAKIGARLQEGAKMVIVGKPNAGKSSLLNALSRQDKAIVTDIAGTTRDVLTANIEIKGFPVELLDTAGLRVSDNPVEKIGIERAKAALEEADHILLVRDITTEQTPDELVAELIPPNLEAIPCTVVNNKCDQVDAALIEKTSCQMMQQFVSAKSGEGIETLEAHLAQVLGLSQCQEGQFLARRRHVDALLRAQAALQKGDQQLHEYAAGELLAEECRIAQEALSEITGQFLADDLLGEIFGHFCIGK